MISGERFIIETLGHWSFGESGDGDLMQWNNLESLVGAVGGAGKVDTISYPEPTIFRGRIESSGIIHESG